MTTHVQSNLERTRQIINILNDADYAALEPYLHEYVVLDVAFPSAGIPPVTYGRQDILIGFMNFPLIFNRFRVKLGRIFDCPATSTVIYELTSDGEIVTGHSYSNRYLNTFVFAGEKVIIWREMFNPIKMRQDRAPLFKER